MPCDYNGLLLEGDEASAHVRRSEADNTYDTSYMYMFKCNDKFGVVDSVDSALYGKSFGGYINHSCTPNVAVKAKMIDGTPTILMYAACDLTTGTHLSFDYGDKRPYVPEWMRSCPNR